MATMAHSAPLPRRVDPYHVTPHLDVIHSVSARLAAGRADREAHELRDAANAIEDVLRAAWGQR